MSDSCVFVLVAQSKEKLQGPDHPALATVLNNLADCHRANRDFEAAEPLYQRSLGIRERVC